MNIQTVQKLAREIRDAIVNSQLPTEFLVDLAAEYSETCEVVNGRLTQVVGLLAEGYRDEAIQFAEQSPRLLDLVAQLDILEKEQWSELLSENQLELPPELMIGAAEQLEQSYEELRQLDHLLKKNRLLALSQAPLPARILILKKLAAKDPTNPIWLDDSEILQRARLSQIKDRYQCAKAKNDTVELSSLEKELKQRWDIPIPKSLYERVVNSSVTLAKAEARSEMESTAVSLNDCLVEYDETAARELRDRWNELNQTASLAPDDTVYLSAQESLQWLAGLDDESNADKEYAAAILKLESAVDQQLPIDQLDRKIYEAQKFERELPETLVHRVNNYRDSLQVNIRRKTWLKVAAGAAVLIACIAAIAWFIDNRANQNQIANARLQMSLFVRDQGFTPGQKYYDSIPERIKNDGEIIRLYDQLIAAESTEDARQSDLVQLIEKVQLTGPLGVDLDDYINEAIQIAVTESEKSQLKVLGNRLRSERQTRQNDRNTLFMKNLEPIQGSLENLISEEVQLDTIAELKILIARVEKLSYSATSRVDGMSGISSMIERNAANVVMKAQARIREIEMSNQAIRDLGKLKTKLQRQAQFAAAIDTFASRYPDDPNTQDFLSSSKERDVWKSFESWRDLAVNLDGKELESITPNESKKLIEQISLASQNPRIAKPAISTQELTRFLVQRQSAPTGGQTLASRLKTTFEQPGFAKIEAVQRGDKLYYVLSSEENTFKYYIKSGEALSTKKKDGDIVGSAPHCEVASQLAVLSDVDQINDYEQLIVRLIESALGANLTIDSGLELDALVQCEFLDQILLFAKFTSPQLKDFVEKQRLDIQTNALLGTEWQAHDEEVDKSRNKAQQFLGRFKKDFVEVRKDLITSENDFSEMIKWKAIKDYSVIGFLYRTKSKWLVETVQRVENGADMYCLIPSTDGSAGFEKIGEFDSGSLNNMSDSLLQAGRPVFVFSPKN